MDRQPHERKHFLDVVELVVDFLRDIHLANKKEEHEVKWPTELRLQAHHDYHYRQTLDFLDDSIYDPETRRSIVLPMLQALNLLNRYTNSCAKRVLGYSVAFRPSLGGSNESAFGLLGNYTLELNFDAFASNLLSFDLTRYASALATTEGSLRIIRCKFTDSNGLFAEPVLRSMLERAPHLEELIVEDYRRSDTLLDALGTDADPFRELTRKPTSLRIISLQYVTLNDWSNVEHGLPLELSPLHRLDSLTTIHLYHPFKRGNFVWRLSWTREPGNEFALDSVWIRVDDHTRSTEIPGAVSELLKTAPHLTFEAPFALAPDAAAIVLPIWTSLRSLTILSDDFPAGYMQHIPPTLDSLVIRFKAHCCRTPTSLMDVMVLNVLKKRGTARARVCISSILSWVFDESAWDWTDAAFAMWDSQLFVKTRKWCIEQEGQFVLDNLLGIPE